MLGSGMAGILTSRFLTTRLWKKKYYKGWDLATVLLQEFYNKHIQMYLIYFNTVILYILKL